MHPSSRRTFLKSTAAAAASLSVASASAANAYVDGDDLLKVGLIGCGSRGTGAASQALRADRNVKLWAMADAFEDRLQGSLDTLQRDRDLLPKIDVPAARKFTGFEAYQRVIESCDVVLLCTPPHFRPMHLRAAVHAGKHVFAEKPVAVDAPGVRSVLETVQEARRRTCRSFPACVSATTTASRKPCAASTTAPSARSPPCRPTTIAAASGSVAASPAGPT
jgi:myo-inositol 2-dehydrogenase/D-chiro-inositol 1-dehydrogenase